MKKTKLDKLPMAAAMLLVVFIVAACAIRLRDDENQTSSAAAAAETSDPLAAKLAECRSVTYEQKDELSECRKAWAEKRRQFLGQTAPPTSDSRRPKPGSSLFVPPKDEGRLPSGSPLIQQTGKE
jgi:conjugative transfer region protein TrbK